MLDTVGIWRYNKSVERARAAYDAHPHSTHNQGEPKWTYCTDADCPDREQYPYHEHRDVPDVGP